MKVEGYKEVNPSDAGPGAPHTAAPKAKMGEFLTPALSSQQRKLKQDKEHTHRHVEPCYCSELAYWELSKHHCCPYRGEDVV